MGIPRIHLFFIYSSSSYLKVQHLHFFDFQLCLLPLNMGTASKQYRMVGLATEAYIFPYALADTLLSHFTFMLTSSSFGEAPVPVCSCGAGPC